MTDETVDRIHTGDWIRAAVWLGAVATLVLMVVLAFAVPALTCGCTQPAPGFTRAP